MENNLAKQKSKAPKQVKGKLKSIVKVVQNIQQVAPENQPRGDPTQMAIYSQPAVVAVGDSDSRPGSRFVDQVGDDDQHMVSPDHADADYETAPSNMELDPEDNPLPPPLGRPGDGPVAAAAAPQGALELMSAQAIRNQPGKCFKPVLSKHVPDHLKSRIWANKYINFQYLIESDPTEELAFQFVPTNSKDSGLTLQPVRPKAKLDGWVAWNKAMCMFMEIYCMKYPNRCMELLQYVGMLNNFSDKFPFHQVYAYDKEFRAELEWYPAKPWNFIDQQLWSTTLHGIHTLPHQGNPQQYVFKQKAGAGGTKSQPRGVDNQFRNCFDYNRGGCNRPSCSFPHVCGRCGSSAHTTFNCPQKKN